MRKAIKWIIGASLIIAAIIALALAKQSAPLPQPQTTAEPIRIGLLLPLTGDGAAYGIPIQRSALMAQEEINASGGILGQRLEFIFEDGKCEAESGAAAAQKLIYIDKIKIIFGGACSSETLAAAPIAEEAKVLMISPSATSPDISNAGDYIFRTVTSDAGQGAIVAEYAYHTMHMRSAAILSEQTDYAQGLRNVFSARFQALGGAVVADERFLSKDTDLRSQILKIKNSGAEIIYLSPQTLPTSELIMKQLTAQEVRITLIGNENFVARDMIAKQPALYAGIVTSENYINEQDPLMSAFVTKYESQYREKPTLLAYMANMYSQLYLFKEGIEAVGSDATKLKDWLYTVKSWKHALGELTFDENGDRVGEYAIKEVQADGTLKELSVVKPQ
ncbi:hypothetical protein A3I42_00425 [Candidatus Uhrbacteria bacterium RIFCSPLOWO2_02_FULL_49_11]|uniref:Leucine-binding protein domain-containing protein n=1 Tax=Candidatus Uhrbacteria bacterium RIFCSPLOWO2_02_FULL_49_11 TaxID=1802409 RepID=A0A1F7VCF0_9BACT|nr:MAG: hypothetical protein A3I42_00425 [Candidatus Uhrbacteria bacterium RIFCSPLOWO2_02_FULL_49_11]